MAPVADADRKDGVMKETMSSMGSDSSAKYEYPFHPHAARQA